MARPSSTGYPFLVQRGKGGTFNYNRDLAPAIAPLVVGGVLLPWSGRDRALGGKSVVKISLGTRDEKTARQRWTCVHPQVDALVQMAEVMARHARKPEMPVDAPRLDPALIRTMAGQAYHDALADDDRGHIEDGFITPAAEVILAVAGCGGGNTRNRIFDAELAARFAERRKLKELLIARKTAELDMRIEEGEHDDADLVSLLPKLKVNDRLAPEQVEALAHGIRLDEVANEVEERLRENSIELPSGHVDRRALALAITRAKLCALNDIAKRDRGAPIKTPARPVAAPAAAVDATCKVPLLSEMPARWIKAERPLQKQIDDGARYVRLFIGLHGDLPVDKITGTHIRAFRDQLLDCPRNAPKRMAGASLAQLAAWAKANPGKRKLGRRTINEKAVGTISTLLGQALLDEHVRSNVAFGQKLKIKTGEGQQRRPYKTEELNRLFRSGIYDSRPRIPEAGKRWAAWWLPLLSLYAGARLEELGQALVSDVRHAHGIPYIEITTLEDEGDGPRETGKSLKSAAARRRVPLHAALIRLGFLDYVASLQRGDGARLFPDLEEQGGRYTKAWSGWWARWLDKHGMSDLALTFHSFRHSFIAEMRRLKCDVSILKSLVGHAQSDVTTGYGHIDGWLHDLGDLNSEVQKIVFPGLDLSYLVGRLSWRSDAIH